MLGDLVRELQKISFASFVFHLRATTDLILPPYKGSTLRGAFGTVFKDTVCVVDHRDCDRCILKQKCAYPYIFDTPVPDDSTRMRKYERAPHPFVIDPPLDTKETYKPADSFRFGLTLIGRAVDYLPYFIYTFERIGAKSGIGSGRRFGNGRFEIESVSWIDADGSENLVYDGKKKVLSNSFHPLTIRNFPETRFDPEHGRTGQNSKLITVNYLTPTRITFDHQLHTYPEFHVVIRNLLRRLSNLAYFHCGQELKLDFKSIIEFAKQIETRDGQVQWRDWERYSARQDVKMKMGGFVGEAEYRGDIFKFVPMLKLGEQLRVGKATGFGLGKYKMAAM